MGKWCNSKNNGGYKKMRNYKQVDTKEAEERDIFAFIFTVIIAIFIVTLFIWSVI